MSAARSVGITRRQIHIAVVFSDDLLGATVYCEVSLNVGSAFGTLKTKMKRVVKENETWLSSACIVSTQLVGQ